MYRLFFFSSRRRHTRFDCDWSSDVCSSDLFVTQLGTNELWKNLGGGRFVNVTVPAGLELPDAVAVGCAFADIDNDGDPDLFVTTVRHGDRLFQNLGHGTFCGITAEAGLGYVGHSAGAGVF